MSDKTAEYAIPTDNEPKGRDHAHQVRRPFLNPTGRFIRNAAVATALGITTLTGLNVVKNQMDHETPLAPPAITHTEGDQTSTRLETKTEGIRIGDLDPHKPPTERLNGKVIIKINKDSNFPTPRTSPGIQNQEEINAISWQQIPEINGESITSATDSNGQIVMELTDPLITRGLNPDDGNPATGIWITVVGKDNKPLYFSASQQTAGFVKLEPKGGENIFEPVSADDNALDFGHVKLEPTIDQPL